MFSRVAGGFMTGINQVMCREKIFFFQSRMIRLSFELDF